MPPDFYFLLSLFAKMAVTAAFVVGATVTAERAGPLIGGLVMTLPISAGPVYFILALDHDSQFIAGAAMTSLTGNAINCAFALVYALMSQKNGVAVSWLVTITVWIALTWLTYFVSWNLWTANLFNLVVIGLGLWIVAPLRKERVPSRKARWYHLAFRGAGVASLVGAAVALSVSLGPERSGTLAVLPVVMTSVAIILHVNLGGPAAGAVMANAILGLIGFAIAATVLHLTAVTLGNTLSLLLALAICMAANALIYTAQRRGVLPV